MRKQVFQNIKTDWEAAVHSHTVSNELEFVLIFSDEHYVTGLDYGGRGNFQTSWSSQIDYANIFSGLLDYTQHCSISAVE